LQRRVALLAMSQRPIPCLTGIDSRQQHHVAPASRERSAVIISRQHREGRSSDSWATPPQSRERCLLAQAHHSPQEGMPIARPC
jgi:hypothetical protein